MLKVKRLTAAFIIFLPIIKRFHCFIVAETTIFLLISLFITVTANTAVLNFGHVQIRQNQCCERLKFTFFTKPFELRQ